MSHSNRPEPRGAAHRSRRQVRLEALTFLEERKLLAPVVASTVPVATFTAAATPTNTDLGTVTVSQAASTIGASAAPLTSVSELTSANSFGGDIVSIQAGPGGDFGKGVYAISRGAGENANAASRNATIQAPINRPGVIYRVDPATGKTSVFFDLNTVANQLTQGGTANNGSSPGSGLVNWYTMSFDPEGVFDGKPSLFVSSLSQTDPTKNVIYRIGPDGSFMGAYVQFTAGSTAQSFVVQPSAVFVPPVEQQNFLKGIFVGQGSGSSAFNGTAAGNFEALFFDANAFRPGQNLSGTTLPTGVSQTPFTFGPQVGFTAENSSYTSPDASAFTDFGTPGAGGIPAAPGLSGVQGLQGELQIGGGGTIVSNYTAAGGATPDTASAILTPFRRFESIAFDQFGYFSYGLGAAAVTPSYQGSTFVSDLGTGLSVQVTPLAPFNVTPINVPIQGPGGPIGVQLGADGVTVEPIFTNDSTTGGNLGGRIVRISPTGVITVFAENFHTSGAQDANAFLQSSLSITFSADGTTLYASDDDGIWQFKTVTDIANASSGQLVGLGDLRSLGAPYDGQDSAVAVVDTGVDSLTPNFRGRVSTGINVLNNSPGNDDTAAAGNGHGTVVAGVIAQFVPQATIDPINVFTPNQVVGGTLGGTLGGNATTPQNIYIGLDFLAKNPFVADPVRPNQQDRVITSEIAFGTTTTYPVETSAEKAFPQVTLAFAAEFQKFRALGIQPIAAAGQFGGTTGATGNVTGISFPAVLNEVISVTGSYSYPFTNTATSTPNDPGTGIVPRPSGPLLLYTTGGTTVGTTINGQGSASVVSAGDALVFKDKLLASSNRSLTTDFTAPETDIPSFSRTVNGTIGGTVAGSVGGTGGNATFGFNNFTSGGTSLSSAIVTGSYAMVESALNYWINIANNNGVTVDGYLNTPVGTHQLNFGKGGVENLSAYTNPDGINAILQWTAVPATDSPNTLDTVNPPTLFQSQNYREYARVDIGNAIAAVEGSIALNYLFAHGDFNLIDADKNGLVTAQELQNFSDNSANTGQAEAGAMARLLGGTATTPTTGAQPTSAGEQPDQPGALQRRFNFFDYAIDGQRNGVISISQYQALSKELLPAPDAFTVTDRQRSSSDGFLISAAPLRNYADLQHTLPTYAFIPKSVVKRFKNISPAKFGVGKGQLPALSTPIFTLFANGQSQAVTKNSPLAKAATAAAKTAAKAATAAASKPATTTTASTTTQASSGTVSPVTTNPVNPIVSLLNSLAQSNNSAPKTTPTTVLSTPTAIGTPAAATAFGVGSVVSPKSTPVVKASHRVGTPAATTASSSTTPIAATKSAESHPMKTAAKANAAATQATTTATGVNTIAAAGTHVSPPAAGHATTAKGSSSKTKASHDTSLTHAWKSIKKIFSH